MAELRLENVRYRYKNARIDALKDISASFTSGGLFSIVGPSGSGKTTLLSILAGLDTPIAGGVTVNGQNIFNYDLDYYRREQVSMIFQAFHLFPLLTAVENVCYPMIMNGQSKKESTIKAATLLESVGINAEKHKRYPANLSGGEQQRVAIARALSTNARILLADEPTGNLDTANGNAVIDILRKLAHENNYCVIIVTHNLEIADASDVVYRMSDGMIMKG